MVPIDAGWKQMFKLELKDKPGCPALPIAYCDCPSSTKSEIIKAFEDYYQQ
jgi:hypothetical protein